MSENEKKYQAFSNLNRSLVQSPLYLSSYRVAFEEVSKQWLVGKLQVIKKRN